MNTNQWHRSTLCLSFVYLLIMCFTTHAQQGDARTKIKVQDASIKRTHQDEKGQMVAHSSDLYALQAQKTIRDAYVRLMRYQTAARDEEAATRGISNKPEDYVLFELRKMHTGPIQELADRQVIDIVTPADGEVLLVTPRHLQFGNGPKHALYDVEWSSVESKADDTKDAKVFALANVLAEFGSYTSYEVTIKLSDKQRTYIAVALHHSGTDSNGKTRTEILDNITASINAVLADESPRVRTPWKTYIKSGLYLAVATEISKKQKASKPLIRADAPIGYLPGDDAVPGTKDQHQSAFAIAEGCVPCAVPTNFHQTAAKDNGNGVLHFEYAWGSSTGHLADLAPCQVGEKVDYTPADLPFASPPFPAGMNPLNPTIVNVGGAGGALQDNHSTPGNFVKPYVAAGITSTQIYRYSCPCSNLGAWATLLGPHDIVRSVSQKKGGRWKFKITKTGSSASIDPLP